MALKLSCPHCSRVHRLAAPYPVPGTELQCWCGRVLSISYPPGLVNRLQTKGETFRDDSQRSLTAGDLSTQHDPEPMKIGTSPPSPGAEDDFDDEPTTVFRREQDPSPQQPPRQAPRRRAPVPFTPSADRAAVQRPSEPTPPAAPIPRAAPRQAPPRQAPRRQAPPRPDPPEAYDSAPTAINIPIGHAPPPAPVPSAPIGASIPSERRGPAPQPAIRRGASAIGGGGESPPPSRKRKSRWRWLGYFLVLCVIGAAGAAAFVYGVIQHYSEDLPTLETLTNYRPPTVTVVYDSDGDPLGEIYEKRRYVVPYESFPKGLKDAFVASEDANFWNHPGVDLEGIVRAVVRNAMEGKKAQGASTITQQVARNFLLTPEKSYARKIREMILATRVEEAFDKEYILYLYLNQIYLGSGAYGVEAAARIYFDKHVEELTVAESAILAGLPQRPSDYSPHKHWEKARARQEYVVDQMVRKGFISASEGDAALAEEVAVYKKKNESRIKAPYFTEHVRRHLVDTYGFDRVYNEGLVAHTTCDLNLQKVAQDEVTRQVTELDWKLGWTGALEHLEGESAITAKRDEVEQALRAADQVAADAALRQPLPARSTLKEGERYTAVALTIEDKHAVMGVGAHEVIVPLSWTTWATEPNENIGWSFRARQTSMKKVLTRGDVVEIRVEALKAEDAKPFKGYAPAAGKGYAAARVYQLPKLQGALLGFDLETGAITAMAGGVDIEQSEFNRTVQAQRQVGSTFKPIVYATAINSRKFTVASQILDGPIVFNTLKQKLWKPGNFGHDYLGNISLRRALALSRNVCTVRVLDIIGLDPVYQMARNLGIESHLEIDLAMGLGSNSLTMKEMGRAYSVFATYGKKVEPYVIERIEDRDGNVLEEYKQPRFEQVLDPTVAGIATYLLRQVATAGTGAASNALGIEVAGKTGTTNDYKDGWFVGFTPRHLAVAWVGYDQPANMTGSSTGGQVALPIWMEYMKAVEPDRKKAPRFAPIPNAEYAPIDESTGRVAGGGRSMPFVKGTVPEGSTDVSVGQATADDLLSTDF